MALVDDIEFYGHKVDAGSMSRDAAAAALVKASGGGLTHAGAAESITNWTSCRAAYEQVGRETAQLLQSILDGKSAGRS
ncbi:hypothetical protein ACIQGT_40085 [Streptomyces sp. NPDC093108]|uniref:hypothetical protein n=1 Tax=Streptomyces sp. NPDC093108 TaxID=3366030 RepID=UPI00382E2A17